MEDDDEFAGDLAGFESEGVGAIAKLSLVLFGIIAAVVVLIIWCFTSGHWVWSFLAHSGAVVFAVLIIAHRAAWYQASEIRLQRRARRNRKSRPSSAAQQ